MDQEADEIKKKRPKEQIQQQPTEGVQPAAIEAESNVVRYQTHPLHSFRIPKKEDSSIANLKESVRYVDNVDDSNESVLQRLAKLPTERIAETKINLKERLLA